MQHLDAREGQCSLVSEGGAVSVAGLDGDATIRSQGGSISLTASDNVGSLQVCLSLRTLPRSTCWPCRLFMSCFPAAWHASCRSADSPCI